MADILDEINLKVVILGDGGVGKTLLVNAITDKEIPQRYIPTIGSIINKKEYLLEDSHFLISVNLWDIGGQRSFNPLNPVFFSNVDIAFLVYDVSNPSKTISVLKKIYLSNLLQKTGECLVFIIGNKIDLEYNEQVIKDLLENEKLDQFPNVYISALSYADVETLLEFAIYSYFKEMTNELSENTIPIGAQDFLNYLSKQSSELESIFNNLGEISYIKIQRKAPMKVSKKTLEREEVEFEKKKFVHERFEDLEIIKEQIRASFQKNIIIIEELINNLKTTPINSLIKNINKTVNQLDYLKEDFELKLNSLLNIDSIDEEKTSALSIKPKPELKGE
ncbi:MAG: GTP-binding protein [Promethearchaeati archaeon]